jgi:ribulose-phosphate 3-epimerase
MSRVKLAPSILAADFARLGAQVAEAEKAGADRIHIDVMDGHFVPNISIGIPVIHSLKAVAATPLETHLMIDRPERYLEDFARAGSKTLIVHAEGATHLHRTLAAIRTLGCRVGVTINPATPASAIDEVLSEVDLVLVMTVNPGFGGQRFIESTIPKIRAIRDRLDVVNPACELEVDGGIDERTAPLAVAAGANVLVAGSAVFAGQGGIEASMQRLRQACGS